MRNQKTKTTKGNKSMNNAKPRILCASVLCLAGIFVALGGAGLYSAPSKAQAQPGTGPAAPRENSPNGPDVVRLVGPVVMNTDLQHLPYIPPSAQIEHPPLTRHPRKTAAGSSQEFSSFEALMEEIFQPIPNMPPPLLTFDGINFVEEGNGHYVPDTNGDVGPNHYVQSVNESFRVFDKNGNPLTDPITLNSFFAPLGGGTPCGNSQNRGDPFLF